MTRWVFDGTLLPSGESGRHEVGRGSAQPLPGRFALTGLVDAHCHLTVERDDIGPLLAGPGVPGKRLDGLAAAGITVVRDVGGDRDVTLRLAGSTRPGQPPVLAAGRFLAPPGGYFPRMHEPVGADQLIPTLEREIDDGATWVKLIADFPELDGDQVVRGSAIEPTYPLEVVTLAVEAAHARGARVAAHTTSPWVSSLVRAGVDSVEHGTALTREDLDTLAGRGGAWTPTLGASVAPSPSDDAAARARRAERSERLAALLPIAVELGVTVMTGSDVVGSVADEVALLCRHGLTPTQALAAASDVARGYLGVDGSDDLVTYAADPREHPEVLMSPASVVVRGVRVR